MEPELLGYLINGLDGDEREEIEQHLRTSLETARQLEILRGVLAPFDDIRRIPEPPTGLALRTCHQLREHPGDPDAAHHC